MSENPYQAPESELEVEVENSDVTNQFYIVSIKKFTVLFFSTFGLYSLYWFYKNWKEYKTHSGKSLWPIPRAIFNIFFTHSLFSEIDKALRNNNKTFNWSPNGLASIYVILALTSHILDKMSMREVGSPYTDVFSVLILPLMYLSLIKSQKAINLSQNDPEGASNAVFTAGNYVWIIFGLIFWALVFLGLAIVLGIVDA
jgi:hypothetical protein